MVDYVNQIRRRLFIVGKNAFDSNAGWESSGRRLAKFL